MQGWYDVTDYGTVGNGGSDDSGAIQSAIEDAGANGGGVIWFPPGTYRLDAGLVIPHPVTLLGAGWQVATGNGSWFYVEDTSITPVYVAPGGAGAAIRDLAVRHNQPSPRPGWTPLNYPFAFSVAATDVHLQNIFLLNATQGINIDNPGGSIGRVVLDRIWGQPMQVGIRIDRAFDVIKINNVHFWPFWSVNDVITGYQKANAEAIQSFRNDNPHFSNLFAFGYKNGLRFGASASGITSKFRITNADLDFCRIGTLIDGNNTTGQVANFTAQGDETRNSSPVGLHVRADGVKLQTSNVRITDYAGNGVRVEGANTMVSLENVWIEEWNKSGQGFPGIEAVAPATVYVGRARWFGEGHGAPQTSARVILDQ